MEGLTRLVTESLARHGFDRPLDYRHLHWSRWFRCESHHSLLFVPSRPGVFTLAEEIIDLGTPRNHVGTAAPGCPAEQSSAGLMWDRISDPARPSTARQDLADTPPETGSRKPEADSSRRMLAVTRFFEDDDMAFVLDRMLSQQNPMRARLISGRYFVRFVVITDQSQRRRICSALNQWVSSAAEKATGIGADFASSLELTPTTEYVRTADVARAPSPATAATDTSVERALLPATAGAANVHVATAASQACPEPSRRVPRSEASGSGTNPGFSAPAPVSTSPQLDSGAATNIHCPSPFPSGF